MLVRLILATLLVTALSAQTLDTVVYFPYEVWQLFHVPEGNKLYVAAFVRDSGTHHIYILDCSTMAVRAVIPTGTDQVFAAPRAAWCPRHNKVYLGVYFYSSPDTAGLAVIDNATDSVLLRLPVGVHQRGIAYSSLSDKLYAVGTTPSPGTITVLDCAADTVLKTITPADYSPALLAVWDSVGDQVYIGCWGWSNADRVTVIDCRTDSVVAVIRSRVGGPEVAAYSPLQRKLYVGTTEGRGLCVIDCATNSVIKRFDSIVTVPLSVPVYCSGEDKVYWPRWTGPPDTLYVIDCATDSIIRKIPTPGRYFLYGAYAPWNNRLYVASTVSGSNLLTVFDCRTDSIIGQTRFGALAAEVVCNPIDHRIYVSDFWDSAVYVFREDLQPLAEEPTLVPAPLLLQLWPNPARDRVTIRWQIPTETELSLRVYNTAGQLVRTLVNGRRKPGRYMLVWDLSGAGGRHVGAGLYFVALDFNGTRAMMKVPVW